MMSTAWYALRSKPHKETMLFGQLKAYGVETYFPVLRVKPVNPRSRKKRPYFPGYLFVHVDLAEQGFSSLNWLPGASGLVAFDGEPGMIPDQLMDAIQKQVEKINLAGGEQLVGLTAGDPVKIESGPLAGFEAIFDSSLAGNERVRVLLKLMEDRKMRVELPAGVVKKRG